MNEKRYKWVVGFLVLTIIATIAVQLFWNYREYQLKKQNLVSNVQSSLDKAVEAYFANITRRGIVTYNINLEERSDTIFVKQASRNSFRKKIDSTLKNISVLGNQKPILIKDERNRNFPFYTSDKILPQNIDSLISKVFISISRDSLDLLKLDGYLKDEFSRNHINVDYAFQYTYIDRFFSDSAVEKKRSLNLENFSETHLKTVSNSTFLPRRGKLELFFTNEFASLLKKSLGNILLSLLLSTGLIASLIYLLKTIYKQKQLAEIKNDLISNITHEFKTPISTIGVALESIKDFNVIDDKKKTKTYVDISTTQLSKLNLMVEKLLETATLDSGNLKLNRERINVYDLLKSIVEKQQILLGEKTLNFKADSKELVADIDVFHFENAVMNVIDNAIKYGGNTVVVGLKQEAGFVKVEISDNGTTLTKDSEDKIFEKFYRVPKGNTHDIKGFGIGLYYAKKIIEKLDGTIHLDLSKNLTAFKISLPNG